MVLYGATIIFGFIGNAAITFTFVTNKVGPVTQYAPTISYHTTTTSAGNAHVTECVHCKPCPLGLASVHLHDAPHLAGPPHKILAS